MGWFGHRKAGEGPPEEILDTVRYRLVRKVAEGGMGAVYEAILRGPEGFGKVVALKTIRQDLTRDPAFVRMFIGEAKLVADLVHQNIVQIYHLGLVDDLYYMAMEFVDGVHLGEFMARHQELGRPLPVDIAIYVISRVCRGLEYAHKKHDLKGRNLGIVHRDVSPKNVMISREGFVKLTDFGIAKARSLEKDLEGEVLMGKVRYMSPEQAAYQTTDARSDLFSLGIVAYELLSGQVVFHAETTEDVLHAVAERPIKPLREVAPGIPEEVARILDTALERDPARRYQDAGKMAFDLEHYMYHDRFGPTAVTLEQYLADLFHFRFGAPP